MALGGWQAQRSTAVHVHVVHGLRAWRLLLLPSIIGERAPALSTLVLYQLLFSALARFETAGLKCALRTTRGRVHISSIARSGMRTDGRAAIGTEAQNWGTNRSLFPVHSHSTQP